MRGPIPDKPQNRPRVNDVLPLVVGYYGLPGHGVGGALHIVLDEGNLDDSSILREREYAAEEADDLGVCLADLLLAMTRTQRKRVYREIHGKRLV